MYKVLGTLNVKMLEKSISVTVNSTVYQKKLLSQLDRLYPSVWLSRKRHRF